MFVKKLKYFSLLMTLLLSLFSCGGGGDIGDGGSEKSDNNKSDSNWDKLTWDKNSWS